MARPTSRLRPTFATSKEPGSSHYNIIHDHELIEASFAEQYGIRLRREDDMSWGEFCTLLSGLNEKTALGRIVSIRAEKDPKIIKEFTPEQKRVRSKWGQFLASKQSKTNQTMSKREYDDKINAIVNAFKSLSK